MNQKLKGIIFGSNGQDGYYLSKLLDGKNIEFICISREGSCLNGDVTDYEFVEKQVRQYQPTHIFNFAAKSTTQHSALFENHQTICTGTLNILEAVRLHCPAARVFISGSALQFKNIGLPINEQTPFDASSAYSLARIQSVYAARYYRDVFGLKVYVGYFFNHDSPLRTEQHVNQKIVKAVRRICAGSREKIELGNIDVRKEYNFALDVVEAVWMLVNQSAVFEAVIGSGEAHSIREWLEYCFSRINKNWKDFVIIKEGFVPEYQVLVSNPQTIMSLGWKRNVDFFRLADIMIDECQ